MSRKPNPFGPSAWAAVGYALIFWVSVTWFVWQAPDWMLSYFVPAATVPLEAVHALFAVCLVMAALAGHTTTAVLLQRGRLLGAWSLLGAGGLVFAGLWALTVDRYMVIGSFADFMNAQTTPIQESHIAGAMNIVGIIQGITAGALLLWLYTDSKRLRAH